MRIAFVSANRESLPDPVIPLGLLYLLQVTPPDDDEALDPALRAARAGLRGQIEALLHEVRRDHPRWIIPSLAVNFDRRLMRALRRQGLTGPLWQHIELSEEASVWPA